ncbi:MAG: ROK family protein [Omnitrophica bacterium]|nr:ROK family protein [Candidatus Omnitrophota bacterium]
MVLKKKTLFTTHPALDRERKNLLFLNLIKTRRTTSRTEVSRLTDTNVVTVSNYINSYIRKGLVVESGYDTSSGGRRPELIEINKRWGYVVGIDIGGGSAKGILAGIDMGVIAEDSISNGAGHDAALLIEKIVQKLSLAAKVDMKEIRKIGIGVSETAEESFEKIVRAKDAIEAKMGIPILCANGALSAAFGEISLNLKISEAKSILYIYTDAGWGVFKSGNEFYEASEKGRSLGYLKPWGENITIERVAKKIVEEGASAKMADIAKGYTGKITAEVAIKAAKEGDEVAMDLVKTVGMNLGVRVAYLINLFVPEAVVVGGGIEEAGGLFFDSLNASVDKFISREIKDKVKLAPAVSGKDVCVKGAAALAIREALIEA